MNALAELVQKHATYFMQLIPLEMRAMPCEIQINAHVLPLKANLACGSCLWTGKNLVACVAFENAFILTQTPTKKKYYVYGVLRSTPKNAGLTYTYVLPPDDILQVSITKPEDADDLLELDTSIKDYAKQSLGW